MRSLPLALAGLLAACSASSREIERPAAVLDAAAPTERRAELATGIVARWIELGPERGEPVLFLHGYTDTSRSFLPTMRALAGVRPDLRLIALDQRGHGGSSLPRDPGCAAEPGTCFEPADFAADAVALLDREGLARVHVVGHSLGSLVAQELALSRPERVQRLVLIGTTASTVANPVADEMLRAGLVEGPWKAEIEARGLAYPRDAWTLTPLDLDPDAVRWMEENWVVEPGADPALLAAIARETARTPLGTWIGVLEALRTVDNRERLAELAAPTLVLWPIQDVFFPEEPDQAELRRALEGSRAQWWWKAYGRRPAAAGEAQSDLGHNLQWATPEAVARDLAAFLREDGAPTRELAYLEGGAVHSEPLGARVIAGAP